MGEDIRVGDVVVKVGGHFLVGRIGRVVSIRAGCFSRITKRSCRGLVLSGFPKPPNGSPDYADFNFKKLPPASDEFTEQIRACKPHRETIDA